MPLDPEAMKELGAGTRFEVHADPDDTRFDLVTLRVPARATVGEMPQRYESFEGVEAAEKAAVYYLVQASQVLDQFGVRDVGTSVRAVARAADTILKSRRGRIAPLGFVVALAVAVLALPQVALARADDALLLARVCVHEAGFESPRDCEGIWSVLRTGAQRQSISLAAYARAYSGRALAGLTSRPWVASLDARGSTPQGWPDYVTTRRRGGVVLVRPHPPWSAYRARWFALLEHCRRVVAGDVTKSCATGPHDWGGEMDAARAERIGLIEVDCGETRNRFYRRPRRGELAR